MGVRDYSSHGKLVTGLVCIVAGTVMLLDKLGLLDWRSALEYWPAALIALGLAQLIQSDQQPGWNGGPK